MGLYINPWTITQLVSASISLFIIIYFLLRGRKTPLLLSYVSFQSIVFIGLLSSFFLDIFFLAGIYSPIIEWLDYFVLKGFVNCFIGLFWLIFCLRYTGEGNRCNKLLLAVLIAIPLIILLVIIINYLPMIFQIFSLQSRQLNTSLEETIHLFRKIVTYSYSLAGTYILIRYSVKQSGYARKISYVLVSVFLIQLVTGIVSEVYNLVFLNKRLQPDYDVLPLSLSLTTFVFAFVVFRYRFLNVIPVAMRNIYDSMREAIIIIDNDKMIIDINNAFKSHFSDYCLNLKNNSIDGLLKRIISRPENQLELNKILGSINIGEHGKYSGEVRVKEGSNKVYLINIQPVYIKNKEYIGKMISFTDITEYRSLVEELTLAKERNRFARDIHDTLGHTMTTLITQLNVSYHMIETDKLKAQSIVSNAISIAKSGLNEIRHSIEGLNLDRFKNIDVICAIQELIMNFNSTGIKIDFTFDDLKINLKPAISDVLFRVCQESLTNSVRHGIAKNVAIVLRFIDGKIRLYVIDDGFGCKSIIKGNGLTGMIQRVEGIGGSIEYGSGEEKGFNIFVEVPVE